MDFFSGEDGINELFCGNGFKVLMSRFKKCMLSGVSGVFLRIRDGEPILFSEDVKDLVNASGLHVSPVDHRRRQCNRCLWRGYIHRNDCCLVFAFGDDCESIAI